MRSMAKQWFPALVILTVLAASVSSGQEGAADPQAPRPVLVDGMGTYSRPIPTDSLKAQQFFDQGLNLVYGYYFPYAAASFQEAMRHDPDSAMLYWGLALAAGPNPNSRYARYEDDPEGEAKRAIETAMGLRADAPPVERGLIETLHVRFDDDTYPDRDARDDAYIRATRELHEKYPGDLEAGFLHADAIMTASRWSYWDSAGQPFPRTSDAVAALDHVMELHPLHPGANHLYIHLLESSHEPERALPSADRLAALVPRAGHIVHMPSHCYIRVGQYEKAIDTNLRSATVDRRFLEQWGDVPVPTFCTYNLTPKNHPGHAHDFIRFASTFQGNYALATKHAAIVPKYRRIEDSPAYQRGHATVWLVHKIFGKWDALDAASPPPEGYPYLDGMWQYVQGSKRVHRGALEEAEEALAKLRRLQSHPDVQDVIIRVNPGARILAIAARGLAGEIALAKGKHDAAIASFQDAVAIEDALGYTEPPDWAHPMRLCLGNALLEASRPTHAETVFRANLARFPENGWALFGLWQSLEAQGKSGEAAKVRKRFEGAWQDADVTLDAAVF